MDVIQFFDTVKLTSKQSMETYVNRIGKYIKAIEAAEKAGQVALVEMLKKDLIVNKYESILFAEGFYYIVTEEQVVEFASKTERGLALDYIENFIRPIPEEVIAKKEKADELEVFDNYVVLHYDPEKTNTAKTEAEIEKELEKKRDPILFGVIAGSRKLYYITDWIDATCDLTLTQFVDTLEIKPTSISDDII